MKDNLLSQTGQIMSMSPIHRAIEVPIFISPDEEDRDVYPTGNSMMLPKDWIVRSELSQEEATKWKKEYANGKGWVGTVALSNQGLAKIFSAIDATVVKNGPGDLPVEAFMCHWAYEVTYTQADGSKGVLSGDYMLDLRLPDDVTGGGARYQDWLNNYRDKLISDRAKALDIKWVKGQTKDEFRESVWFSLSDEDQAQIEKIATYRATNAVIKRRPFLVQLAQTGARNRAIRVMGVKSWYFPHELEHPLRIRRTEFDWERASDLFGEQGTKAMLLQLVQQQFGLETGQLLELMAPVQTPTPAAEFVEGEYEEAQAEEVTVERSDIIDFDKLGFNTPYTGISTDVNVRLKMIEMMDDLLALGYETRDERHALLAELFPSIEILDGYLVGHIALLDKWIDYVNETGDRERATVILRRGFDRNFSWDAAAADIAVDENTELVEELAEEDEDF